MRPRAVGQKLANGWGLVDMAGNVIEWVHDGYQEDLGAAPTSNPLGASVGKLRVRRGGAWDYQADAVRAGYRFFAQPEDKDTRNGFRCARTLGSP